MPRDVVLFLTHVLRPVHALRLQRLHRETAGQADCFLLYESPAEAAPTVLGSPSGVAIHAFRAAELPSRLGYDYMAPYGLIPGSAHYPLIDFFRHHSYRHYWVIENDVEFTGNWAALLRAGSAISADLLASHVMHHRDSPNWSWWDSLRAPFPSNLTMARRIGGLRKAFLPIYRVSSDALRLIDGLHRRGWTGHFEVLLPTAICGAGLHVVDLNTLGSLYKGAEQDPTSDVSRLSTLRWRPAVSLAEFTHRFTTSTLYHPVKGAWTFDGARVINAPADDDGPPDPDLAAAHLGAPDESPAVGTATVPILPIGRPRTLYHPLTFRWRRVQHRLLGHPG